MEVFEQEKKRTVCSTVPKDQKSKKISFEYPKKKKEKKKEELFEIKFRKAYRNISAKKNTLVYYFP